MKIKCLSVAALALLVGCSTCADAAWADGLPQRAPYQYGYVGVKDRPAVAPFSWTGFYIGGGGGYGWGDTELSAAVPAVNVQGLSSRGWSADARGGFDWQMGNSPVVLGVLGGYNMGHQEFTASAGATTLLATLTPTWYFGFRGGLAIQQTTLVYAGYAYSHADLAITGPIPCAGPVTCEHSLNGHNLLLGLEKALSPNISFAVEFKHTWHDQAHLIAAPTNLNLDPSANEVKFRINIRTGNLFGN